jgi:hypothetical protein
VDGAPTLLAAAAAAHPSGRYLLADAADLPFLTPRSTWRWKSRMTRQTRGSPRASGNQPGHRVEPYDAQPCCRHHPRRQLRSCRH